MTRNKLLKIVEKAYQKRGFQVEKKTCLVTENRNEFGLSINTKFPFVGAGFYLLLDEIKKEIEKSGGTVKELGLYADYYIWHIAY